MTKPLVLVTAPTISERAQEILREAGAELAFMKLPISEQDLLSTFAARRVSALLVRGSPPLNARVIAAAKDLKIISKHGAGIDSVDVAAATKHGVAVMMATGGNADAVAEHTLTLMLAIVRELPRFHRDLANGVWKDLGYHVRDFRERTVGVIGYGQIGRRAAKLAAACGAQIVIHSRSRVEPPRGMTWEGDLDRLLQQVDILSLHCALTQRTRGMIGARELALMKRGAIVINTARGPVIDEPALIAALASGHLGGAGLDTFAKEPLPQESPLLAMPNVICTPHIASSTTGSMRQLATIACNNIVSWLRGEVYDAQHFVNPEVLKAKR